MTRFILIALSFVLMMPISAKAEEFTPAQKEALEQMMEKYLLENGENILKAVNQYQAEVAEQDRREASKKAEGFLKEMKNKDNLPMTGSAKGDITIVEFFDYNCGYCGQALKEIQKVLKKDDNIKVVFMDMPILGPSSRNIAEWSLAAHEQGKYFEFHRAVFDHDGQKDDKALEKIAKSVGLDVKKLKKDAGSDKIASVLDENIAQAGNMGIRGTPGFIIGDQVYPGFMEADQIHEIIAEARKK